MSDEKKDVNSQQENVGKKGIKKSLSSLLQAWALL